MRSVGLNPVLLKELQERKPFLHAVVTASPEQVKAMMDDPQTDLNERCHEGRVYAIPLLASRAKSSPYNPQIMNPEDAEVLHLLISHPGVEVHSDVGFSEFSLLEVMEANNSTYLQAVTTWLLQRNLAIAAPLKEEMQKAFEAAAESLFTYRYTPSCKEERERWFAVSQELQRSEALEACKTPDEKRALIKKTEKSLLHDADRAREKPFLTLGLTLLDTLPKLLASAFAPQKAKDEEISPIDPERFHAAAKIGERDLTPGHMAAAAYFACHTFLRQAFALERKIEPRRADQKVLHTAFPLAITAMHKTLIGEQSFHRAYPV